MTANKPMLISEQTRSVLYMGYMTTYKIKLIEEYRRFGYSESKAIKCAEEYLSTESGQFEIENFIENKMDELQLNQLVEAFSKANGPARQLGINLLSSGVGAFLGPFVVAAIHAWFKLR